MWQLRWSSTSQRADERVCYTHRSIGYIALSLTDDVWIAVCSPYPLVNPDGGFSWWHILPFITTHMKTPCVMIDAYNRPTYTPLCMIATFQSWEINQQKLINHDLLHFEIYWLYCQVILFGTFFITITTEMTIILHCYGCCRLALGVCHVALQYSAPLMEAYSFQFLYYIDCFIVNLLRIRIEKLMRWSASPRKTPHFKWIDQFSSPCYALSQVKFEYPIFRIFKLLCK